ncbi:MAG: RAD55 family ATPase [Candidatus Geothermincolia bacterium]
MNERSKMDRVATGIAGLDEMLRGGLLRSSVALVKGAPGTGKSSFGLTFVATGAAGAGEPGIVLTFEQFPSKIARDAASIGVDLAELETRGLVRTVFTSPEVMLPQLRGGDGALERVIGETGARRIFVDSITQMERLTADPVELRAIIKAFLGSLVEQGLTVLISQEDPELMGSMAASEYGVSYLVDTVIQLRYLELDSSVERALLVIKQRATAHDMGIRRYSISSEGVRVEQPFDDLEGVLSGSPRREMSAFMDLFGGKSRKEDRGA